ncbi:hypothetical protein GGP46_002986 [Salinibacter ruber]|nr:hypothetical protein [Salinibacter ruber]
MGNRTYSSEFKLQVVLEALQHRIRQGLQSDNWSYPDQKGKPTQRLTARRIFQSFEGIHVLHVGSQHFVLNMEEHHRTAVSILEPGYERLFVSHPTQGGGVSDIPFVSC